MNVFLFRGGCGACVCRASYRLFFFVCLFAFDNLVGTAKFACVLLDSWLFDGFLFSACLMKPSQDGHV